MARFSIILCLVALLAHAVSAHYVLNYPPSRGFVEDSEPTAPCGGFNNLTSRTPFPLQNGFVEIYSEHLSAVINISLVLNSNPQASDFTGATLIRTASVSNPGNICLPVNIGSAAASGANVTLQLTYQAGDGLLYQCADLTLSATTPANWNASACVNSTATSADGSDTPNGNGTSTSKSGASSVSVSLGLPLIIAMLALLTSKL